MKRRALHWGLAAIATFSSLHALAAPVAERVFVGEHIITMDAQQPSAEAVAISEGKIVYVGSEAGVKEFIGESTDVEKLGDRALVPGLIDSHGHLTMAARMVDFVNASSPPVGPAETIDDILELLRQKIAADKPAPGEWIMAYGYDDSLLKEQRHPTREDLDKVSTEIPIYMMHVSGHLGTANSAALAAVGVDENSPDPEGGVYRRFPDSKVPNGVVEESATYSLLLPQFMTAAKDPGKFREQVKKAVEYFASFGITTIQDGGSQMADFNTLRSMGEAGEIEADIVMLPATMGGGHSHGPGPSSGSGESGKHPAEAFYKEGYQGQVRSGGVKFVLDGSPQGRTAWTTEPYNELPDGAVAPYTAYPTVDPEKYKADAKELLLAGVPVYSHANGDAAIDLALDAVEEAFAGGEIPDHRSVIIHAQLMRQDQLDRAKKLRMIPSFYSAHPFFWGDWHRKSFGDERALGISPAASALKKGVHFTIHNDTPVVPPDMMRLMWVAVNRETRNGFILGEDERLAPYDALYAMTLGGAYQYSEEAIKGSLTVGKQADLVILGADPLQVDPATIKDVPVLETISRGRTIFEK